MPLFPSDQFGSFALVVGLGVFVQSATGFAGGLLIVPLMLWFGHGVPEAQTALLTATIPQNCLGVYRFREHVDLKAMKWPIVLRLISLPLGVAVLHSVDNFPKESIRQMVSGVVLGCVLLILLLKPKPTKHLHFGWTLLAFLTSGFFAGLTGTGGPMMVLWIQAHDWSTQKTRSFLFVMYLLSIPIALAMLYIAFGERIVTAICSALLLIPLVLIVTQLGLRAGSLLGRNRLRRVTMVLLLVLGVVGIVSPLLR